MTSRVLTVWFLIHHGRRKIVHFDITEHPTAPWVSQQLRESFPHESGPSSLVFDHDSIFAQSVVSTIQAMGIEAKRIAARSPWQNGVAERWIGSCRRVRRARSGVVELAIELENPAVRGASWLDSSLFDRM